LIEARSILEIWTKQLWTAVVCIVVLRSVPVWRSWWLPRKDDAQFLDVHSLLVLHIQSRKGRWFGVLLVDLVVWILPKNKDDTGEYHSQVRVGIGWYGSERVLLANITLASRHVIGQNYGNSQFARIIMHNVQVVEVSMADIQADLRQDAERQRGRMLCWNYWPTAIMRGAGTGYIVWTFAGTWTRAKANHSAEGKLHTFLEQLPHNHRIIAWYWPHTIVCIILEGQNTGLLLFISQQEQMMNIGFTGIA
jgi:hypothetical protein